MSHPGGFATAMILEAWRCLAEQSGKRAQPTIASVLWCGIFRHGSILSLVQPLSWNPSGCPQGVTRRSRTLQPRGAGHTRPDPPFTRNVSSSSRHAGSSNRWGARPPQRLLNALGWVHAIKHISWLKPFVAGKPKEQRLLPATKSQSAQRVPMDWPFWATLPLSLPAGPQRPH